MTESTLYLIPSPLGEADYSTLFPSSNLSVVDKIDAFIVEDERTARRFLIKLGISKKIDDLTFISFKKNGENEELLVFLRENAKKGKDIGLLSDAGTPCIADPGHLIVQEAHRLNMRVVPLVGPNSIVLALMASGLNGQNFAFHGYLAIEKSKREKELRFLESLIFRTGQTQIFIETPYRNNQLLASILTVCNPDLKLCVATNITTREEKIVTLSISKWRKEEIDLHKQPTIFLLGR